MRSRLCLRGVGPGEATGEGLGAVLVENGWGQAWIGLVVNSVYWL